MSRAIALAMVALGLALSGCGGPPPLVSLDSTWPDKAGDYEEVTRAWTRRGDVVADLSHNKDHVLEVWATFKSPEWRTAYVEFRSRQTHMSGAARAALLEQHRADAEQAYEVQLIVATKDRRINDLQKNLKSTWRVALAGDSGEEVRPVEIKRDRRSRSEIRAEFPQMGDFHTAYIARFPKSIEVLGADAQKLRLTMASSQGGVVLVWATK